MPLRPDEVSELSSLLDEALDLDRAWRELWLQEMDRSRPEIAQRLRGMLQQAESSDTALLPKLPKVDPDDAVAETGERVGPYLLVREIGRGGMGSVWLADRADGAFKRRLALKLPRLTWSAGLAKRIARERDIGALLEHPNIARLYDAGVDEHGRPYIAMEFIDGQPIDDYCREHALDVRARLKLFLQVVQAVAYAHGRLVLHRDLKPSNVLVDTSGQAHLLDFGIARLLDDTTGSDLTQEQGRVLTLSYAAPEHIAGRPIGVTADVYALGVLLYELLTGTLPFTAKRGTAGALEDAILAGDTPLPSSRVSDARLARQLRGDLDAIVGKAIKRDPNERYQTAEAFATDIQRYLDGQAIVARPDSAWYRLRKAIARHRVPVTAVTTVIVVALVGLTTTLMQGHRAAHEADRARLATAFVSELFRVNATQAAPQTSSPASASPVAFVDRGAELIETRFQGQPELQAELYGAVGRVYLDLGADRLATEYATRQFALLRSQKASASRVARALMLLAETALLAHRDLDAERFAREALDVLPRDDVLAPEALVLMMRTQSRSGKNQEAKRTAAEARRLLTSAGATPSVAGAILTWFEGWELARENRFDEARPFYEAAIDEAVLAQGPNSPAAIDMRFRYAYQLTTRGHPAEGRRVVDTAVSTLEGLGNAGRIQAALGRAELRVFEFIFGSASYSDTIAVLSTDAAFLQSQAAVIPSELLASFDFERARAFVVRGEHALAEPLLETSARLMLDTTQSLGVQWEVGTLRGLNAMCLGQHERADGFLRHAFDARVGRGRGHLPFASNDWAAIALNLSMQGRHRDAEAFLLKAPRFDALRGDPEGADYADVIPEAIARVRLDAGDVRGAKQALPLTKRAGYEDRGIVGYKHYYQLRGEIRCALGEYRAGLDDLSRSLESQGTLMGPSSPWLARMRGVAGLCALALGDRRQAEHLASEAQRAFEFQPDVSPYFKEPLIRLEQKLRPSRATKS